MMTSIHSRWRVTLGVIRSALIGVFLATAVGVLPIDAQAQGGRVQVLVLGHFTHDVESGQEEWTFEVTAEDVPNLDGRGKVSLKTTHNGDSDPDFLAFRDTTDKLLFDYTYSNNLPRWIYIVQDGWENDGGARDKYDDGDDSYGPGAVYLLVQGLENGKPYTFDFPSLQGGEGRMHGLRLKLIVTSQ